LQLAGEEMNETEKYQFDLNGFFVVKGLLKPDEVKRYLAAADQLEDHVARYIGAEPSYIGHFGIRYHYDEKLGFSSYKNDWGGGLQYIVEDFMNASGAFDTLVAHAPTMEYMPALAIGPYQWGSAELRYRYKGNMTLTHMGGVIDPRNRYEFVGRPLLNSATGNRDSRDFNLLVVRVIYALHDIPNENGAFCVVPGTHKSNFFSPYGDDPTKEPGMVGIPMEAGDALFFTENLRHGGLPNLYDRPRKTIHLQIGPTWAGSQSPAHWNGNIYLSPESWLRYSDEQRALFPSFHAMRPPIAAKQATSDVNDTSEQLRHQVQNLQNEVRALEQEINQMRHSRSWQMTAPLRRALSLSRRMSARSK
jgi:Phytanoyl-CoA dioxygenase (PhyH)